MFVLINVIPTHNILLKMDLTIGSTRAGSGQNDHLSEIISHILEPIVKMRPNGMEVTSTGDFVSRIDGIKKMTIPIEDINLGEIDDKMEAEILKEIDEHIDTQERNAQEVYDNFDNEMAQNAAKNEQGIILPGGSRLDTTLAVPVGERDGNMLSNWLSNIDKPYQKDNKCTSSKHKWRSP